MKIISLCNYARSGVYNLYINNRFPVSLFKESIVAIAFNLNDLRYAIKEINNLEIAHFQKRVHIYFYLSPAIYDYHHLILLLIQDECHIKFFETTCLPFNTNGLYTNWMNNHEHIRKIILKKNEIAYINAMVSLKKEQSEYTRLTLPYFYHDTLKACRIRYHLLKKLHIKRNRFILYMMSDLILNTIQKKFKIL